MRNFRRQEALKNYLQNLKGASNPSMMVHNKNVVLDQPFDRFSKPYSFKKIF